MNTHITNNTTTCAIKPTLNIRTKYRILGSFCLDRVLLVPKIDSTNI